MSDLQKIEAHAIRARKAAFPILRDRIKTALPKGWRLHLAVGWGVTVMDELGRMVEFEDFYGRAFGQSPHQPKARLRRAVKLAEKFGDIFWFENEIVES